MSTPSLLWVNQFATLPSQGGGTRHFGIGRELNRRGWQVGVLASDFNLQERRYTRRARAGERAPVREDADGVTFQWLWAAPYRGNDWRRALNWLSFSREVVRCRPVVPPALVIGSSPQLFAAAAAERLARRLGVPFVLEVRDLWPESLSAVSGRQGPAYHVMAAVARSLYRRATRIIVLARGVADHLESRYGVAPGRCLYVPNGVDAAAFKPGTGGIDGTFTAVYAGAHGPANGLEAVLDAADQLQGDPRIRFLLIGDGPAKPTLVAAAARRRLSNVEFCAAMPKAAVAERLRSADAGLMVLRDTPLFAYGVSPNKLFDYMAAGLPVISNVPGDVAAMVRAAGAGLQTADSSGAALAASVRRLADTAAAERRRMGQLGREWVIRDHSRGVLAARLDAALRPLLPVPDAARPSLA